MFLLHCLAWPCCGPVTSSEILVADCSKKLKDFGPSNFVLFRPPHLGELQIVYSCGKLLLPPKIPKFLSHLASTCWLGD
jgi:hypothetical protein